MELPIVLFSQNDCGSRQGIYARQQERTGLNPDMGNESRASRDQQSKKLQDLIGCSRLLHSNRLQEDLSLCHAEFGINLEMDLASERAKHAGELEQEIAASRKKYDERRSSVCGRIRSEALKQSCLKSGVKAKQSSRSCC